MACLFELLEIEQINHLTICTYKICLQNFI